MIERLWAERDKNLPKAGLFLVRQLLKNIKKQYEQGLETLNEGLVFYPVYLPFLAEKLICLMALTEW